MPPKSKTLQPSNKELFAPQQGNDRPLQSLLTELDKAETHHLEGEFNNYRDIYPEETSCIVERGIQAE